MVSRKQEGDRPRRLGITKHRKGNRLTVGELTHHWLQLIAPGIRNSTLRAYKEVVGLRVLGHERLASTPVDKLAPRKVAGWWQDTVEAFPDTAYRNHRAYQKLRTIMNLAVEYGYLRLSLTVPMHGAGITPVEHTRHPPSSIPADRPHNSRRYAYLYCRRTLGAPHPCMQSGLPLSL